jgi:hypothetical protein
MSFYQYKLKIIFNKKVGFIFQLIQIFNFFIEIIKIFTYI